MMICSTMNSTTHNAAAILTAARSSAVSEKLHEFHVIEYFAKSLKVTQNDTLSSEWVYVSPN